MAKLPYLSEELAH